MSQADLSIAVGISESMISKYANNYKVMSLKQAKLISDILRCQIEDLYDWQFPSSAKGE